MDSQRAEAADSPRPPGEPLPGPSAFRPTRRRAPAGARVRTDRRMALPRRRRPL